MGGPTLGTGARARWGGRSTPAGGAARAAALCLLGVTGCGCPETPPPPPTTGAASGAVCGLWADGTDFVVLAQPSGTVTVLRAGRRAVYHFGERPCRIWGSSRRGIHISGVGTDYRFDGQRWIARPTRFPDARCHLVSRPGRSLPFGRCGDHLIVTRQKNVFVVHHRADDGVVLHGLHGSAANRVYVVGTRRFHDDGGKLVGWEPVILRNLGSGWEAVSTPFDATADLTAEDADPLDLRGRLTSARTVAVRPTEVIIGDGFLGGAAIHDGVTWRWSPQWTRHLSVASDGRLYKTDGELLGVSHAVLVRTGDDTWRSLSSDLQAGILGLQGVDGGVLAYGCILGAQWNHLACVEPAAWYLGLQGGRTRLYWPTSRK